MVGQIAVTLALLVVAGLVARSLSASQHANVGFRTGGLAILSTDPAWRGTTRPRARRSGTAPSSASVPCPSVENVALADRLPFSLNFGEQQIHVPGQMSPDDRGFTIAVTARLARVLRDPGRAHPAGPRLPPLGHPEVAAAWWW